MLASILLSALLSLIPGLTRDAEAGDSVAQYRLSTLYRTGADSIPADTTRWISLLRSSAQAGYPVAQNMLGYLYGSGIALPQRPDSARYWIRRAADAGDPRAATNIAYLLLHSPEADESAPSEAVSGLSPESQADSIVRYLRIGADAGIPEALSQLADLYREGRFLPADTLRAARLYTDAFDAGLPDAELRLMNMLIPPIQSHLLPRQRLLIARHLLFPSNPSDPNDSSRRESGSGESGAHDLYSRLSASLAGRRPKPIMAVELMKNTVDLLPAGDPQRAQTLRILGDAYAQARGVPYNHQLSLDYYRQAAAEGDPDALQILQDLHQFFPDL